MSIFRCSICDEMKDSDDGCVERLKGHPTNSDLVCLDCDIERNPDE